MPSSVSPARTVQKRSPGRPTAIRSRAAGASCARAGAARPTSNHPAASLAAVPAAPPATTSAASAAIGVETPRAPVHETATRRENTRRTLSVGRRERGTATRPALIVRLR